MQIGLEQMRWPQRQADSAVPAASTPATKQPNHGIGNYCSHPTCSLAAGCRRLGGSGRGSGTGGPWMGTPAALRAPGRQWANHDSSRLEGGNSTRGHLPERCHMPLLVLCKQL